MLARFVCNTRNQLAHWGNVSIASNALIVTFGSIAHYNGPFLKQFFCFLNHWASKVDKLRVYCKEEGTMNCQIDFHAKSIHLSSSVHLTIEPICRFCLPSNRRMLAITLSNYYHSHQGPLFQHYLGWWIYCIYICSHLLLLWAFSI